MSKEIVKTKPLTDDERYLQDQQARIENFVANTNRSKGVGLSEDNQIKLPKGMTVEVAIKELQRYYKQDEEVIEFDEVFKEYAYADALHAANQVLELEFGWIDTRTIHTFFGDIRPEYEPIAIGIDENERQITKSCVKNKIGLSLMENGSLYLIKSREGFFQMHFEVKQKFRPFCEYLAEQVKDYLKKKSIYKGKILLADSSYSTDSFKFIRLKKTDIHLPSDTRATQQIITNRMRKNETRTTALLYGAVGTGGVRCNVLI